MKYLKLTEGNIDKILGSRELTLNYRLVVGNKEARIDGKALREHLNKAVKLIYYPEKRLVHVIGNNFTVEIQLTQNGYAPRFTYVKEA